MPNLASRDSGVSRDLGNHGSVVKNMPAVQETYETSVPSLGWEDPLAKEMATCSSILAWKIPWTEDPGRLQSIGSQRVPEGLKESDMTEQLNAHTEIIILSIIPQGHPSGEQGMSRKDQSVHLQFIVSTAG